MKFENMLDDAVLQGRRREREEDFRGAYFRDTTAVIHSSAFRRLKHKTQVFYSPSNDHICTRIEHSLHVASIASVLCKGLGLNDEIAWAIGMGHDLGHTPFGHTGEKIISKRLLSEGKEVFQHEVHSLRTVDFIGNLNLTYAVRDGIVCHCGEAFMQSLKPTHRVRDLESVKTIRGLVPATWEGCAVRFADQIAYLGRDFEDACRLNVVAKSDIPEEAAKVLGTRNADIINTLVNDLTANSSPEKGLCFSDGVFSAIKIMKEFNYTRIYRSELMEGYERYFSRLINLIFDYLEDLFEQYGFDEKPYHEEKNMLATAFYKHISETREKYLEHDGNFDYMIADYVEGMTDNFCLDCASEILTPMHITESIENLSMGKWFDINR